MCEEWGTRASVGGQDLKERRLKQVRLGAASKRRRRRGKAREGLPVRGGASKHSDVRGVLCRKGDRQSLYCATLAKALEIWRRLDCVSVEVVLGPLGTGPWASRYWSLPVSLSH